MKPLNSLRYLAASSIWLATVAVAVRQDFVVMHGPVGDAPLRVELDVTGARAEALGNGARLVLDGSGRKIAYSRLHVVDAGGKVLTARMEVTTEARLALLVEDAGATYPMRIDPTFSDADWISMGGLPGAGWWVNATVVDGSGNLYIGGNFTVVGEVLATHVAKLNGSASAASSLPSIPISKISINHSTALPVSVTRDRRET